MRKYKTKYAYKHAHQTQIFKETVVSNLILSLLTKNHRRLHADVIEIDPCKWFKLNLYNFDPI